MTESSAPTGAADAARHDEVGAGAGAAGIGPAKDVVCSKTVNPQATPWSIKHGDTTYYFCSLSCALQFKSAPEAFAAGKAARRG